MRILSRKTANKRVEFCINKLMKMFRMSLPLQARVNGTLSDKSYS